MKIKKLKIYSTIKKNKNYLILKKENKLKKKNKKVNQL